MKTIYLDSDYHCHVDDAEGRTAVQTDAFDAMSNGEIECYLYMPLEDDRAFIQCFDSIRADAFHRQFVEDNEILNIITGVSADDES